MNKEKNLYIENNEKKYCANCGNLLNVNEIYCGKCGTVINNKQNEQEINNNWNHLKRNNKTTKNNISIILGIISLILVFIFQIFVIPLSIVGIVFGIKILKADNKNKFGLILNIISLVIAIPIFILYLQVLSSNPTVGRWGCKNFDGSGPNGDYIVTMILNKNNKFEWGKYNDEVNNHVTGTYEFKDLNKTNYSKTVDYYSITMTGEEYVNEGKIQTEEYKSRYEMGIFKDNKQQAILMNIDTYNMYFCYKR